MQNRTRDKADLADYLPFPADKPAILIFEIFISGKADQL